MYNTGRVDICNCYHSSFDPPIFNFLSYEIILTETAQMPMLHKGEENPGTSNLETLKDVLVLGEMAVD